MVERNDTQGAGHRPALAVKCRVVIDAVWLLALMIYALAGMRLAPFHGDESMQIYASHDFATLFIHRQPANLLTSPPYPIDSDQHLRIINGSINRYSIGLAWYLAGMTEADLPALWSWPEGYDANLSAGRRPGDDLLTIARIPSTLFLALSVAVMFALGNQFAGRLLAYLASGLYAFNPIILLNGRRAMQEGSFLCFGLLTLLMAAIITRRQEEGVRRLWPWWASLSAAAGLALASKHNSVVFVAGAFGGILVVELARRRWQSLPGVSLRLALSGLGALALFVALSPALWNQPIARMGDLLAARQELLESQFTANSNALLTIPQRLSGMITQPFLSPVQYYEVAFWSDFEPITVEIRRYEASHLDGLHFGMVLGLPLTALAWLGVGVTLWPKARPNPSWAFSVGLLVWLAVILASLLVNPLPWQRYYLPLIPVMSLLAGIGLVGLARLLLGQRREVDSQAS